MHLLINIIWNVLIVFEIFRMKNNCFVHQTFFAYNFYNVCFFNKNSIWLNVLSKKIVFFNDFLWIVNNKFDFFNNIKKQRFSIDFVNKKTYTIIVCIAKKSSNIMTKQKYNIIVKRLFKIMIFIFCEKIKTK